jgi:prolyl oligopeptidase
MKKLLVAVSLCLIIVYVSGCSSSQNSAPSSEEEKLQQIFAQYEKWTMERSPEWAASLGDESKAGEMDDYSLEGIEKDHRHLLKEMEKMQTLDRSQLSESDKLSYDLFKLHLELQIEGHKFKGYLRPVQQFVGRGSIHLYIIRMPTFSVFSTGKNYRDFLSKLSHVPRVVDETIEIMKIGLKEKITFPKDAVHAVDGQIASMLVDNPARTPLFEPFEKMPKNMVEKTRKELREKARKVIGEKVIPAFRRLHTFWTEEYYPNCIETIGLSSLPNGVDWYKYLIKYYTTTDLSADQIHQMGLKEVARIKGEMNKIIKEVGFKGTFEEFVQFLRTDPQFYYTNAEDLMTGYRDLCKRIDPELPKIIGKLPRLTYGVREITAAEAAGLLGYCDVGSLELGRPSYLAISTHNLKAIKKYQMTAIILHEMVPGHHLQFALGMEQENVPFWRKEYVYFAYAEGWALYSENLGYEMGVYTDPYARFGQLDLSMLRAVRLVVDTGIHTKGWGRQKAIDYLKANTSLDDNFVLTEVDRYIVYPGQALSYKVGEQEFLRLRRLADKELGQDFDIREFHDRLLEDGSLTLNMLAEKIERYIAEKKKGMKN